MGKAQKQLKNRLHKMQEAKKKKKPLNEEQLIKLLEDTLAKLPEIDRMKYNPFTHPKEYLMDNGIMPGDAFVENFREQLSKLALLQDQYERTNKSTV